MFHDSREVKAIASGPPAIGGSTMLAAIEAYCSIGVESAIVSKRLIDNTEKLWLSAATYKDAKDACRATAAFVNSSYRDVSENAVAMVRIWRRFIREAL
jgi:hypothetical protein